MHRLFYTHDRCLRHIIIKMLVCKGAVFMPLMKLSDNHLKDSITVGDADVLSVNINHPSFEGENSDTCKKLNSFYADAAQSYYNHLKSLFLKNKYDGAKCGASMNWYVSFLNEKVLSLLTDAYFFDGNVQRSVRLVHNWHLPDCTPLRARQVFAVNRSAKQLYLDEICAKISAGEGGVHYGSDAEKRARRRFDFENFYLTPKGVAFYYDKTQLTLGKDANPAFVMPFAGVQGLNRDIL